MKGTYSMSDSDFDVAWRAFAEEDAQLEAPARVRHRVMAAWKASHQDHAPAPSTRRHIGHAAVALAAAALLIAVGLAAAYLGRTRHGATTPDTVATRPHESDAEVPLVRLTADAAYETESLQLVRLRMPRTNLEVFGVALLDPDASRLVDVDVVIGDDGLPRDIRRVRPVLDVNGPQ
jgi:hypothetical protein